MVVLVDLEEIEGTVQGRQIGETSGVSSFFEELSRIDDEDDGGSQDSEDGYHYQELYEGEGGLVTPACHILLFYIVLILNVYAHVRYANPSLQPSNHSSNVLYYATYPKLSR